MEKNTNEGVLRVPESEAAEVRNKLRRQLPKVPLSVYGFVDRKNRRLIHVAADHPDDSSKRADLHYLADSGVGKIVADAKKKLTERFALS